jgi:hypothetical protein
VELHLLLEHSKAVLEQVGHVETKGVGLLVVVDLDSLLRHDVAFAALPVAVVSHPVLMYVLPDVHWHVHHGHPGGKGHCQRVDGGALR